MVKFYYLFYHTIPFIYILYITLFTHLSCYYNISSLFSVIYKKLQYLSDETQLNFMTEEYNNICKKNNEISNLLKQKYDKDNEKYLCLYNKSIYLLIDEHSFENWFNLT